MENNPLIVAAVLQLNGQVLEGQLELTNRIGNVENVQIQIQQQVQALAQGQVQLQQQVQALAQGQVQLQQQVQALAQGQVQLQQQVQALAQGQAQLQQQINTNQNALLGILNQNMGLSLQERNRLFRISNRSCAVFDQLNPILAADGTVPPNFPHTKTALASLSSAQLAELLVAYQQDADGNKPIRFEHFSTFIGC